MKFGHIAFEVSDMKQSTNFYQELGFQVESFLSLGGEDIVFLLKDGITLELIQAKATVPYQPHTHICFEVETLKEILGKPFEFMDGINVYENGWKNIFISGPDREIIEFLQKS